MAQVSVCVLLVVTTILTCSQGWKHHGQTIARTNIVWDNGYRVKPPQGIPGNSPHWEHGFPGRYPSMPIPETVKQMPSYHNPHHYAHFPDVGFPGSVSPGGGFPGGGFPGGGFPGSVSPGGGFPGSILPGGGYPGGGYPGGGYPGGGYPGGGYPGGGGNPPYRDFPYFNPPPMPMPGMIKLPTLPPARVPQTSRPKFMPPTPFISPERLLPENEDLSREVEVGFSSTSEEDLPSPAPPSLPTLDRLPSQLIPPRPKPAVKTVPATTPIPPTTVEPTTGLPTTVAESMTEPATTEAASTPEPTTEAATTVEATTKAVTTAEPTTDAATTAEPTTDAATTVKPTIAEPTTKKSTNEQAKTEASTTGGCDDCTTEYRMTIGARYIGTKIVPWHGYK